MATSTIKKETPANIGAYTQAETDAAIAQSTATFDVPAIQAGTSYFDIGKAILNHLLLQNMTVGKIYGVVAWVSDWDMLAGYCIKLADGSIRAVVSNSGSLMLNCNVLNSVYNVYTFEGTAQS